MFYKQFALRGYNYQGEFQGIELCTRTGSYAKIKWQQNWVTFLDAMLQVNVLSRNSSDLLMPNQLRSLRIYPQYHKLQLENNNVLEMFTNHPQKKSICGGVEIVDVTTEAIPRRQPLSMIQLADYRFVPHIPAPKMSEIDILRCTVQIVLENLSKPILNVLEICGKTSYISSLMSIANEYAGVKSKFMQYHKSKNIQISEIHGKTYPFESQTSVLINLLVMTCQDISEACAAYKQHIEDGGFILMHLYTDLQNMQIPQGFVALAVFPVEKETFLLLKKCLHQKFSSLTEIIEITKVDERDIKLKIETLSKSKKEVILVARKSKYSGLQNLVRNLRNLIDVKTIVIKGIYIEDDTAPVFDMNLPFYKEQIQLGLALNVYKQGHWGTYRHVLLKTNTSPSKCINHVRAQMQQLCDITSLHWEDGYLNPTEAEVRIAFSALNELDIMCAYGHPSRSSSQKTFSIEYSGLDMKTQKRIMGLAHQDALSSHLKEKTNFTWEVPSQWSLKDAATIPVAYLTAYYAFFIEVKIQAGESVLIHSGCTDIGLAAIQIALANDIDVFTTVDNEGKKKFLIEQFSQLKAQNIVSSQNNAFENLIVKETNGKGVNYVLNTLSGSQFKASLRCLSGRGHFLEIGKFDITNNNEMGLGVFLREISFHAVDLTKLFNESEKIKILKELLEKDIKNGVVKPLPAAVFAAHDITSAFKALIGKQDAGKVLIQIRDNENDVATMPISVKHKVYFAPDSVYILCGEWTDVMLELANWLIERGVRKLVLNSNKQMTYYQQFKFDLMNSQGCNVSMQTFDTFTEKGSLNLLTAANKLGSVGGIFHFTGGQETNLEALDELSQKMCTQLEYFVVFTSVSIAKGSVCGVNYDTTNSTLEHLIEQRVVKGLYGKAIHWNLADVDTNVKISQYIESLDVLLNCDKNLVCSFVVSKLNVSITKSALTTLAKELALNNKEDMSLANFQTDPLKLLEIKFALEREFEIYLSVLDLKNLKLNELKELLEQKRQTIAETDLLETNENNLTLKYLSLIEKQPLPASNELSLINNVSHGVPVIVFAGFGGQATKAWQIIANSLEFPTYLYQYDSDESIQTLQNMTQSAFKKISQFLLARNFRAFNIIAYSVGAAIAHDVTVLLEKQGMCGKLVFVDSSKIFAANLMYDISKTYAGQTLPKSMMEMLIHELVPIVPLADIRKEMRFRNFRENVLVYARNLLQKHKIKNANLIVLFMNEIVKRVTIFQTLPSELTFEPLESEALLIRAGVNVLEDVDPKYGLEPLTMNTLEIEVIDGNHRTMLNNEVLPQIINNFLKRV